MLRYRNGSMVAYVGMKDATQRTKIRSVGMSGDVDIVVMEEGHEFIEADFNELRARLRGKMGKYRQIIVATNPDSPMHWIKVRLIDGGEASVYYSGAKDNPTNPADYLETLEGDGHRVPAAGARQVGGCRGRGTRQLGRRCQPGRRRGLAVAAGVAAHRRDRLRAGAPQRRPVVGGGWRREDDPVPRDLQDADGVWRTWRSCASSTTRPTR